MKYVKEIDNMKGIYKIECESIEEAKQLLESVKQEYPFAIINREHYYSNTYILNVFADWETTGLVKTKIAEDGEPTTCIECGKCDEIIQPSRHSSPGIGSAPERCFFEQFWAEVYQERNRHFTNGKNVYSYTTGKGGFCNRRFDIELDDGTILKNIGLWHRGEAPKCIIDVLRKEIKK